MRHGNSRGVLVPKEPPPSLHLALSETLHQICGLKNASPPAVKCWTSTVLVKIETVECCLMDRYYEKRVDSCHLKSEVRNFPIRTNFMVFM